MKQRPLSFTRNLGGLPNVYRAIRKGFKPGITVDDFWRRCGLSRDRSLLVTEFFLFTQVRDAKEYVIGDTLVNQTLSLTSYQTALARLYFFALNLNMPGERLSAAQRSPSAIQNTVIKTIYEGQGWRADGFDKDKSLEPLVKKIGAFKAAVRKWVTNYWYMKEQCAFVTGADGTIETFADTWGLLALQLFFERYSYDCPTEDVSTLVNAAYQAELHKVLGVPRNWLDERLEGAADMFVNKETYAFEGFKETNQERKAARDDLPMPKPPAGTPAERRERKVKQLKRRTDNRNFLRSLYNGICQISGIVLKVPGGGFTVDYAHIRPLGWPHRGPDDVSNMLSLSPTMHRLFDRGCIMIDPDSLEITLLHGNDDIPHLKKLVVHEKHELSTEYLKYHNSKRS